MLSSVDGTVVFEVHPRANKTEITQAIEKLFEVKVKSVRVANYLGKMKRVGLRTGRRGAWKKAYVTLHEGTIDLIEGL
jgi:large subunit ribosomal protein L23